MQLLEEPVLTRNVLSKQHLLEGSQVEKALQAVEDIVALHTASVGTWNRGIEEGKEPIRLRFFKRLEEEMEKEINQKARAIGRLMTNRDIRVEIEKDRS